MLDSSADSGARFERVDHGETVTVYVHGEVDLAVRDRFRLAIHDALAVARTALYLDLSDVAFIDSSGVHALLDARRATRSRNADLVLLTPSKAVLRVLQVCCVVDMFDIRDHVGVTSWSGARSRS